MYYSKKYKIQILVNVCSIVWMKEPVLKMPRSFSAVTRQFFSMERHKDRYSVLLLFHRLLLIISTVLFIFTIYLTLW